MDKAKAAVASFIGRSGHHETTVEESVNPAVTKEEIKPVRHEEVQEAVDREVHQDHYHTTVQPIQHQEVLPEQHTHQMAPVVEKKFEHDDASQVRQQLESQAAQFRDARTTHETQHTSGTADRVEGEHVHHHVHEKVQPIIHKETIQPEVVHTTIPIHEVHRAEAEHHGTSVLPVKKLEEFTAGGGTLTGGSTRAHEAYEGDPKPYNPALQVDRTEADTNFHAHDGLHDHQRAMGSSGVSGNTTAGPHSSNLENKLDPRVDSDRDGRSGLGTAATGTGAGTGIGNNTTGLADRDGGAGIDSQTRVDPRIDATGGSALSDTTGHHHGEGAAAGVGAAGVAAGGYEAVKHHETTQGGGVGALDQDPAGQPRGGNDATGAPTATSQGIDKEQTGVSSSNTASTHAPLDNSNTDRSAPMADNPDTQSSTAPDSTDAPQHHEKGENSSGNPTGEDPAVVDTKDKKLTGTGAPGSHSALFGLTPDGHKEKEADYSGSKAGESAGGEGGEEGTGTDKTQGAGDEPSATGDGGHPETSAAAGSGVHEQLNDPKVAEKGHGGGAETDVTGGKPGGGSSLATPSQGTGDVGKDA